MEKFYSLCRQHNLKITPQRTAIYKVVTADRTHPTADAVYKQVKKGCPNISFDTVNRTLISFVEIGLIYAVECSGQGRRYDPSDAPHHHFKCVNCSQVFDIYDKSLDAIKIPRTCQKRFHIVNKRVVLSGYCENCSPGDN